MRWLLVAIAAPYAVVLGWLWVILMMAIGAATQPWLEPHARLSAQWRPWAAKLWRYSTTIGFGKIFQAGHRDSAHIAAHEEIHCQQVEDLMMVSALVGLGSGLAAWDPWLGVAVYISGGIWQLPNFLTAAARHGWRNAYRDSGHERRAYAETDTIRDGKSWAELRDDRRDRG